MTYPTKEEKLHPGACTCPACSPDLWAAGIKGSKTPGECNEGLDQSRECTSNAGLGSSPPAPVTSKQRGDPFELVCTWLESALKCNNFHWDTDQQEAATECLEVAREQLKRINDLSIHLSSGGKPDEPIYTRADVGFFVGVIRAAEAAKASPSQATTGFPQPNQDPECEVHHYLMGDGRCSCLPVGQVFRPAHETFGKEPWRVALPKITEQHTADFIGYRSLMEFKGSKWEWTQDAVDFACMLQGVRQEAMRPEEPSADGLTKVRDRTANVALTCSGACRYSNGVLIADPACDTHGSAQKAEEPELCPRCQQSMPGGVALHTDHCPQVKATEPHRGYTVTKEEQDEIDRTGATEKATEGRRPTGQCSWGCYYSEEDGLIRDPACTVHGASKKASCDHRRGVDDSGHCVMCDESIMPPLNGTGK